MKIKEGFMLHTIAGSTVVVPVGEATTILNGIISLNDSGVLLWNLLAKGADTDQLADGLIKEYGIPDSKASKDANSFIESLRKIGCLEE